MLSCSTKGTGVMRNHRNNRLLGLCLWVLSACCIVSLAKAFAPRAASYPTRCGKRRQSPAATLQSSPEDNSQNEFFEEAARKGAKRIATMSTEERTKRAMLAEAVEDRMVLLYDDLEILLGEDGLPSSKENRDEVEVLAREIKSLRTEYQILVTGGQSPMLDSIDGTRTGDDGCK